MLFEDCVDEYERYFGKNLGLNVNLPLGNNCVNSDIPPFPIIKFPKRTKLQFGEL